MPELPEVETIRRGLHRHIVDQRIADVDVRLPKIFQLAGSEGMQRVIGAKVRSVKRRGKLVLIALSTDVTLVIHLKMTGQLIFREPARTGRSRSPARRTGSGRGGHAKVKLAGGHPIPTVGEHLPGKVTHAIIKFTSGSELFFNDQRQFGYIKLVPNSDLDSVPLLATFGPEPLSRDFTLEVFRERLRRRRTAKLKPLLLDQTFLAGLGNIYVDEALNLAKLHPLKVAGRLTRQQSAALYKAIRQVLKLALAQGGTSVSTYVTVRGGRGNYLGNARVYHRTHEPCLACGTPIRRIVVAGRGTHLCPRCQRPPRANPRKTVRKQTR